MKVTRKMTLPQYDEFCNTELTGKIPKWFTGTFKQRVGDCIYDYSKGEPPKLRASVHKELNRKRDLGGKCVLLSHEFYYFGDKPVPLPDELLPIVKSNQGHKRVESEFLIRSFEEWISKLPLGHLRVQPQLKKEFTTKRDVRSKCSRKDHEDDNSTQEETVC